MHIGRRSQHALGGLGSVLVACALLLQVLLGAAPPGVAGQAADQALLLSLCADHAGTAPGPVQPADLPCTDHAHCLLCQAHATPALLPSAPLPAQPRSRPATGWPSLPGLATARGRANYAPRGPPVG